jgi:hypothetical protein
MDNLSAGGVPDAYSQDSLYASYLNNVYGSAMQAAQEQMAPAQVNYADGPSSGMNFNIGPSGGLMQLDPDPFGERTRALAATNPGSGVTGDTALGLDVFGKRFSREQLLTTDAGRELLEIAESRRKGHRRGFLDALTDFSWGDLPFVSLFATVGGSIADAALVSRTFEKLQNGEPVTDEELLKTKLYQEKSKYDRDGSWGATVGDILRAAPGFAVEFFLSGGTYSLARAGLSKAAGAGIHLGLTRATKVLARESMQQFAEQEVAKVAGRTFADLAGDELRDGLVSKVSKQIANATMRNNPMYRGLSDDAITALAQERASYEFGKMLARNTGGKMAQRFNTYSQWLGQNISRGLMDFGNWGTSESTVLYTTSSSAARSLFDAVGTFFVEAPLKGAMMYGANRAVTGAGAALTGTDAVSDTELSLKHSAYLTGNRELMENAGNIALFSNMLEYISENTGRGLSSLVRTAGLGLEKAGARGLVKPAATRLTDVGGLIPDANGVEAGGRLRQMVAKAFGTREDYTKRVTERKGGIVARALNVTDPADVAAVTRAVNTGSTVGLRRELADAIGPDINRFTDDAVKAAYEGERNGALNTAYLKFKLADYMARHQIGPESMMNLFERMGYDGVIEEVFEERYNDFAKGFFGLDDRPESEKDILSNIKKAFHDGFLPEWDQLLAEVVGFGVPMVARAGIMRLQSAVGGGGALSEMRAHLSGMDDAMRHSAAASMTLGEYLSAHNRLADQDEREIAALESEKAAAVQANDRDAIDQLTRDIDTARTVQARRAERHERFMSTIDEAARDNLDAMVNIQLLDKALLADDMREGLTPTATSEQVGRAMEASNDILDYSPTLARKLYESEAILQDEDLKWYRRAAHRILGVAGSLVTGDLSLAAANPAMWIARDMGMSRNTLNALKAGFAKEFARTAESIAAGRKSVHDGLAAIESEIGRLRATGTSVDGTALSEEELAQAIADETANLEAFKRRPDNAKVLQDGPAFNPSREEVLQETERRFARRARQIVTANFAAHQLYHFSKGRMTDQAAAHHARLNGYAILHDRNTGDATFARLSEDGSSIDRSTEVTVKKYYEDNKEAVDSIRGDLVTATVDLMTRRLTKSADSQQRLLHTVKVTPQSGMLEPAIYDAAMSMAGLSDLVYRVEVDGVTPLAEVLKSKGVAEFDPRIVGLIASKDRVEDVDPRALESFARSLRLQFDGTDDGLTDRDRRLFNIAKLVQFTGRDGVLQYVHPLDINDESNRLAPNGNLTLTARDNGDGTFSAPVGPRGTSETFASLQALENRLASLGYHRTHGRIVLTQAKVIESRDMFHMLRELGLAQRYADALEREGVKLVHPMLRKDDSNRYIDEGEAKEILAKELAAAERGRVSDPGTAPYAAYDRVWGEKGYMTIGERILATASVRRSTVSKYAGEFNEYQPTVYTLALRAGRLSAQSLDTYVPIDASVHADIESSVLDSVLIQAFTTHPKLLRSRLSNVISDFVNQVDALAADLQEDVKDSDPVLASNIADFRRMCTAKVDRIETGPDGNARVAHGVGMTATGFTTLAGQFAAFRAGKDLSHPFAMACARLASDVWKLPSFPNFMNLVDLTLGGNGFLEEAIRSATGKDMAPANQRGLARAVAYATSSTEGLSEAFRQSMPGGLGYSQFLDICVRQMTAMLKKPIPPAVVESARAAAAAADAHVSSPEVHATNHMTFLAALKRVVGIAVDTDRDVSIQEFESLYSLIDAAKSDPGVTEDQKVSIDNLLGKLRRVQVRTGEATDRLTELNRTVRSLRRKVTNRDAKVARLTEELKGFRKAERAERRRLARAEAKLAAAVTAKQEADLAADSLPANEPSAEVAEARREVEAASAEYTEALNEANRAFGAVDASIPTVEVSRDLMSALFGGDSNAPAVDTGTPEDTLSGMSIAESEEEDDNGFDFSTGGITEDVPALPALPEDRLTIVRGELEDGGTHEFTQEHAAVAVNVIVRALRAMDLPVSEDSVVGMSRRFMQSLHPWETDMIAAKFRQLDDLRMTRFQEWDDFAVPGIQWGAEDDKADDDTASNKFNNIALDEYNSPLVSSFLALAGRVLPLTQGSLQGFVRTLRDSLARIPNGTADSAVTRILAVLDSRTNPAGHTPAELSALMIRAVDQLTLGSADTVSALIDGLNPASRVGAFFVSYLSSLPESERLRFALLCVNSVPASPIHIDASGEFRPAYKGSMGKIPESIVAECFSKFIGSSPDAAKLAGARILELASARKSSPVGLEARADAVAEILDEVLGRENPLSLALTTGFARARWAAGLSESTRKTLTKALDPADASDGVLATIAATLRQLGGSKEQDLSRDTVTAEATTVFAVGRPDITGLTAPSRSPYITDPVLTIISAYTDAVPSTIRSAEIDTERDREGSSVVVAPRDLPPLVLRWMWLDESEEGSFASLCRRAGADDAAITRCRQQAIWPDGTSIYAKNISTSLTPSEIYGVCEKTYSRKVSPVWYVPLYSGDHSSGSLIQIPRDSVNLGEGSYKDVAKRLYRAIGFHLMHTDTKRAALSSTEATGVGMVGVDVSGDVPAFGECRVHILRNWGFRRDGLDFGGDRKPDEAFLGLTFVRGYGADMAKRIAKDPMSSSLKLHMMSASGRDLFFIKSLSVSTSERTGKFLADSSPRAVEDYLESFRGKSALDTDILTDNDSYKIGIAGSKAIQALTPSGKPAKLMDVVFARLEEQVRGKYPVTDEASLADAFKREFGKLTGDELDALVGDLTIVDRPRNGGVPQGGVKLSQLLPGAIVNFVDGFNGPCLDLSYQENGTMAYPVANVSHDSKIPRSPGRMARNMELDTLAMTRTLGIDPADSDAVAIVSRWGLLAQAVASQREFRDECTAKSTGYGELIRNHEDPEGVNALSEKARAIWAEIRKMYNVPIVGIDMPLVSAGASIDNNGKVFCHSRSKMVQAMLRGSEVFTEDEAKFFGQARRLALCCINCDSPSFRYGWFLDSGAFLKSEVGAAAYESAQANTKGRRIALALAKVIGDMRDAAKEASLRGLPPERRAEAKARALRLRELLADSFVDHHNVKISSYGDRYVARVSYEDLFRGDGTFDLSAVQCDSGDLVHNDASGKDHIFLGGTMFGFPRTPSYNGAPWLQTVRAGLPVTEIETDNGSGETIWKPGRDAMVMPDPYTNMILGCDHDGDKTKTYMLATQANGLAPVAVPPDPFDGLPESDATRYVSYANNDRVDAGDLISGRVGVQERFLRRLAQDGWLARYWRDPETGVVKELHISDRRPGSFFNVSDARRTMVSNAFVQDMFDMSRRLPVKDADGNPRTSVKGQPRLKFVGGVASEPTKAFPVENGDSLREAAAPALFSGDATLGDPETAMAVATSAEDADSARGTMVAIARALHVAWFAKQNGSVFETLESNDWLKFIHRVDGLSNATFDDIKEQICGRLGWTRGLIEAAVASLVEPAVNGGKLPTTDAEVSAALRRFASTVNMGGVKSNVYRRATDPTDSEFARTLQGRLAGGRQVSFNSICEALGVDYDPKSGTLFHTGAKGKLAPLGEALCRNREGLLILRRAGDRKGANYVAAELFLIAGLLADTEVSAEELDGMLESLEGMTRALEAVRKARQLERSVNYLTADPGSAFGTAGRLDDSFARAVFSDPYELTGALSDPVTHDVLSKMHVANAMAYDMGSGVKTLAAKAQDAVNLDPLDAFRVAELSGPFKMSRSSDVSAYAAAAVRMEVRDALPGNDRMNLEANARQIPQLFGLFRSMPGLSSEVAGTPFRRGVHLYTAAKGMATALAERHNQPKSVALGFRRAVESLFATMYELMSTSTELNSVDGNRAPVYFRAAPDTAYGAKDIEDFNGMVSKVLPYGKLGQNLSRIMPHYRAGDEATIERIRGMVDDVIKGRAYIGTRKRPIGATRCGTFTLSLDSLAQMVAEAAKDSAPPKDAGSSVDALVAYVKQSVKKVGNDALLRDVIDAAHALDGLAKATGVTKVTPSVMFGQLLPLYTLATSRTLGAPKPTSPSIINFLPERYYRSVSAAEAELYRNATAMWQLMVRTDWRPLSILKSSRIPANQNKYGRLDSDAYAKRAVGFLRAVAKDDPGLAPKPVEGRESRDNPDYRNTVDFMSDDAFLYLAKWADDPAPAQSSVPSAGNGVKPTAKTYDSHTASLAVAMGGLLPWARVEYTGGHTFTVRGELKGNIGAGRAVCFVVDTSPLATCDTPEQVTALAQSSAYLASLAECADLGLSASELAALPLSVREALVRTFGVGAATSNQVGFSLDGHGLGTLTGAIRLPAGKGSTRMYHEYFHQMMRMFEAMGMFSAEDYNAFVRQFGKAPEGSSLRFNEEKAAESFRKWVVKGTDPGATEVRGLFARILDTLRDFFSMLLKGFGYSGDTNDDTLFRMMVYGIAHASDSRVGEIRRSLSSAEADRFDAAVDARDYLAVASMIQGNIPVTPVKARPEDLAAKMDARLAALRADAVDDPLDQVDVPQAISAAMYDLETRVTGALQDGTSGPVVLGLLRRLADLRLQAATDAGVTLPEIRAAGEDVAFSTGAPEGSNEARDAEIRREVSRIASPLTEVNEFYRAADAMNRALREGLERSGSWSGPLESVIARYSVPNWKNGTEEERDREALLSGIRRALTALNPEAADRLDDKTLGDSLVFQAALRMFQKMESAFAPRIKGVHGYHAGQFQISAWILAVDPSTPSFIASKALARSRELRADNPTGEVPVELDRHIWALQKLSDLTDDPTGLSRRDGSDAMPVINTVISQLTEGIRSPGRDISGNLMDFEPDEISPNAEALRRHDAFARVKDDRAVQESLKGALDAAYQVAAMSKFRQELDIVPPTAEDLIASAELAAVNSIPPPATDAEWATCMAIGDTQLASGAPLVELHDQSHFIAHNADMWLSSLVRKSFGAPNNIGEMLSAEHREYAAIKSRIQGVENFMSYLFGTNVEDGGRILKVLRHRNRFAFEDGAVVQKDGDMYVKFDNYRRAQCDVTLDESDLRDIDLYLKACAAYACRQRTLVTGVDRLYFHAAMSRRSADYSAAAIRAKWNDGRPAEPLNPLEMACVRLMKQLPETFLFGNGFYDRFVDAAVRAMEVAEATAAEYSDLGTRPGVFNAAALGYLRSRGYCVAVNKSGAKFRKTGTPRYTTGAVAVSVADVDRAFHASDAYNKLTSAEGGRSAKMLSRDYVRDTFMNVWHEAASFVRKHPWLTHGDGKYFNAFGTALPFWRGSGVFMYNAVRSHRERTPEETAGTEESFLVQLAGSSDAGAPLSSAARTGLEIPLAKASSLFGLAKTPDELLNGIVSGLYEPGTPLAESTGFALPRDATKADLADVMYRHMLETVLASYREARPDPAVRDAQAAIDAYESALGAKGEIFGGSIGLNDEQMYLREGVLPANMQLGHKVHVAIDGITNAMMARATLANLLMTPAADGMPVYYADPSQYAEATSGLTDAFWSQLAMWWAGTNGLKYDAGASGIANAKRLYAEILAAREANKGKVKGKLYSELDRDMARDVVTVDRWLVRDGGDDDESALNRLGGGEAMGYLKHFVQASRVTGFGGPKVRALLHRPLSWSKSMSVSVSFFFPIATKWESPIASLGVMATLASNVKGVGDFARKHPDAFNFIQKAFGGSGWMTKDFLGFSDIIEMMDTNDPFLAELISWADALGVTISETSVNPIEPTKSLIESDIRRLKTMIYDRMGSKAAAKFGRIMDTLVLRQGDKAFRYALNATKLATVAQLAMRLRHEATRRGKAFDPIRDLRKYAGYINAEVGGIDPMRYAWAHPVNQSIMNTLLFSWQWTRGAWEAGGGTMLEDALFGGHSTTKEERAFYLGRWLRMYGAVMIGVPALLQALAMTAAKLLGGGDDEDDKWATFDNEDKTRSTAADITPFLRAVSRFDDSVLGGALRKFKESGGTATGTIGAGLGALMGARGGNWLTALIGGAAGALTGSYVPSLVPMYTGTDEANRTSRRRRYYLHFGKQGWEFFRWFDDAWSQFFSKLSMPTQRIVEGIVGRNLGYLDRGLPWEDMGQFERWLSLSGDSALVNMLQAWAPFSMGGLSRMGDAGFISLYGPVQMGASQTAIQDRLVTRLTAWAENDKAGYSYGFLKGQGRKVKASHGLSAQVADILEDARRNGLDPEDQLNKALGQVLTKFYGKFIDLIPDQPDGDVDAKAVGKAARALNRLGAKKANVLKSFKTRLERQGRPYDDADEATGQMYLNAVRRLNSPFINTDY